MEIESTIELSLSAELDLSTALDSIAQELEQNGYAVIDQLFPESVLEKLEADLQYHLNSNALTPAGIGREGDFQTNTSIRGDSTYWLEESHAAAAEYFAFMEQLRHLANRYFYLGLFRYECHYALYPTGAFYQKHLDAFKGRSNRRLSTVFYLNRDWPEGAGGELLLYPPVEGSHWQCCHDQSCYDQSFRNIESEPLSEKPINEAPIKVIRPEFGRLVVFFSEDFPHEVQVAKKERMSLTGWFRVND
ncbi:2OG-Fe(II) oxygenase [Marinibactrum halimedae]|uniref:2OG-Fe(II) oxygenase n=1 Tax=Marinibactrum halimedae TaxID=1444977 RepID=A0AA37T5W8_9GAMM|nr:2OG-Fe(II) oxygenase [Marinibactrum halimedae]MCD9460200.1 2OG-Fe(II) oxygenase [Marinibactrum halimedae]GLS27968.1 2OG-Fe(II) oxygenase [Marinibactrum halimedae]